MAQFDNVMEAAQRRVAELELERRQFQDYNTQREQHIQDMQQEHQELLDEANLLRAQARQQQPILLLF